MTDRARFSGRRRVALIATLAFALASTGTSFARADATGADVETARTLYKDGKDLRAKGDLQGSLAKLRAAHTLAATPITALELGRALALVNELVEARETWLSIERLPVRPDESTKAAASRRDAVKLVDKITPRIASLSIVLDPPRAADAPEPSLRIDDHEVPAEVLTVARKVNPGHHTIAVVLGRARATSDVEVREGEAKTVTLTLHDDPTLVTAAPTSRPALDPTPAPAASLVGSAPTNATPPDAASPRGRSTSPLVYAGLGTAAVGVVVGSFTGVLALSRASTVKSACVNKQCGPDNHDDLDGSRTMGTVSTIAFVVAGAGVVAAAVGWLTNGSDPAPSRAATHAVVSVHARVLLGGAGLEGEF